VTTTLRDQLQSGLAGSYRLDHELGGGAMSRVFLAEELSLGRRVVVKLLPPELAAAVSVERFRREVLLAAQLQHPHIVPVLAAGETRGLPYYTMPFIEGESLRARIARVGPLPVADAVRILRDVGSALSYAHAQGVVHRDIKPANVLISGGFAMVTDFGVAKALSLATRGEDAGSGTIGTGAMALGTPAYMPPEQAAADPHADHRADIYSLGALAYDLLVGEPPFAGRSPLMVLLAHATEQPVPVGERRPAVPATLSHLVMRCLEKRPADRPQSVDEFLQMLEVCAAAVSGASITPVHASLAAPAPRALWQRVRRRVVTAASGAVVLAGAVVAATLLVRRDGKAADLQRDVLLVQPFTNRTGEPRLDNLGAEALTYLSGQIAKTDLVKVVDAGTTLDTAADAAHTAHARLVVAGEYTRRGDSVFFTAKLIEVASRAIIYTTPSTGAPADDPLPALDVVRQRLMGYLATNYDPRLKGWANRPLQPPRYDAYQAFVEGLSRYTATADESHSAEAMRHFERAVRLDPGYVPARLWMALAALRLSQWPLADSITQQLDAVRDSLSAFEKALLDNTRATLDGDVLKRIAAMREAASRAPGSEWAVQLAGELVRGGYAQEALDTLVHVAPDSGFLRNSARYWVIQADAYHHLGQFEQALAAVRTAERRHPDQRVWLRPMEAAQLAGLGRVDEVMQVAKAIESEAAHDQQEYDAAQQLRDISLELRGHGHVEPARRLMERSYHVLMTTWPKDTLATEWHRNMQAVSLFFLDRVDSAYKVLGAVVREMPDTLAFSGFYGVLAAHVGDTATARRVDAMLAAREREKYTFGAPQLDRAYIAAVLGEREQAVDLLRAAISRGAAGYPGLHVDMDFGKLRGYPAYDWLLLPKADPARPRRRALWPLW